MAKARFPLERGPQQQDPHNIPKPQGGPLGIMERIGQDSSKPFPPSSQMKKSV